MRAILKRGILQPAVVVAERRKASKSSCCLQSVQDRIRSNEYVVGENDDVVVHSVYSLCMLQLFVCVFLPTSPMAQEPKQISCPLL